MANHDKRQRGALWEMTPVSFQSEPPRVAPSFKPIHSECLVPGETQMKPRRILISVSFGVI